MQSIGSRLFMAFVCMVFILVLQGAFAVYTARETALTQRAAVEKELSVKSHQERLAQTRLLVFKLIGTNNPEEMDRLREAFDSWIDELETGLESHHIDPDLLRRSRATYEEVIALHYDFFSNLARNIINTKSEALHEELYSILEQKAGDISRAARLRIARARHGSFMVTLGFCGVALLVASLWAVFLARSLTDRKRSEEELGRLRNLLSNTIDSMPSVLVGVDPRGMVNQWNLEAQKLTGVPAKKALGRALGEVFPDLSGEMEKVYLAMERGVPVKDEKVPVEKNGETRVRDITVYPLVSSGLSGAAIRMDDVTIRANMEEIMVQTEKMMSVGGLAAGMAHEINNPLAGILQNSQVLEQRLSAGLPANQKAAEAAGVNLEALESYMNARKIFEILGNIKISTTRATHIVDNMLSFSRKGDSNLTRHDIRELLDKTVDLAASDYDLEKKYDFRHIEIVRGYPENPPGIVCEPSKIQQVFLNILKNAAQAMEGMEARGESPCITLGIAEQGKEVQVTITDNGPGMDEKIRKRVFEPFFTTKTVGDGTGLGLSVSYFIITENHGGTMTLDSAKGRGTRFVIRLPVDGN